MLPAEKLDLPSIDESLYTACVELNKDKVASILASDQKPTSERLNKIIQRMVKSHHYSAEHAELIKSSLLSHGACADRRITRFIIGSFYRDTPLKDCLIKHLTALIGGQFKPLIQPSSEVDSHALKNFQPRSLDDLKLAVSNALTVQDKLNAIHQICLMIQYAIHQNQEAASYQALLMQTYLEALRNVELCKAPYLPAIFASACGLQDELQYEIDDEANILTRYQMLTYAAINGHRALVETLLDDKFIPATFISTLIQYGRHDFYELVKQRNSNFARRFCFGALHTAISCDEFELFSDLIQHKPNLEEAGETNETALINAVKSGKTQFALKLIEAGANINARETNTHLTPFHYACQNGYLELVMAMLETHSINFRVSKTTGLHLAADRGHLDIVREVLKKYPELATKITEKGETALSLAIDQYRSDELIDLLFECDQDKTDVAFISACRNQYAKYLEKTLQRRIPSQKSWVLGLQIACALGQEIDPNVIRHLLRCDHPLSETLASEIKQNCKAKCPEVIEDIDAKLKSQEPKVETDLPVHVKEISKDNVTEVTADQSLIPIAPEGPIVSLITNPSITNKPRKNKLLAIDFNKTWVHVMHPQVTNPDLQILVKQAKANGWQIVFVSQITHEESLRNLTDMATILQDRYGPDSNWQELLQNHFMLINTKSITTHLSIGYPEKTTELDNTQIDLMLYEQMLYDFICKNPNYKNLLLNARKWFSDQYGMNPKLEIHPNDIIYNKDSSPENWKARQFVYKAEYYKHSKRAGNEFKLQQLAELRERFNAETILMIDGSDQITDGINQAAPTWLVEDGCQLRGITYPARAISRMANGEADETDHALSKKFDAELLETGFDLETDRKARALAVKELTAYQYRTIFGIRFAGHKARAQAMILQIQDRSNRQWRDLIDNQLSKFSGETTSQDFTLGKSSLDKAFKWKTKAWFWDTLQKIKYATPEPEDQSNGLQLD